MSSPFISLSALMLNPKERSAQLLFQAEPRQAIVVSLENSEVISKYDFGGKPE